MYGHELITTANQSQEHQAVASGHIITFGPEGDGTDRT